MKAQNESESEKRESSFHASSSSRHDTTEEDDSSIKSLQELRKRHVGHTALMALSTAEEAESSSSSLRQENVFPCTEMRSNIAGPTTTTTMTTSSSSTTIVAPIPKSALPRPDAVRARALEAHERMIANAHNAQNITSSSSSGSSSVSSTTTRNDDVIAAAAGAGSGAPSLQYEATYSVLMRILIVCILFLFARKLFGYQSQSGGFGGI